MAKWENHGCFPAKAAHQWGIFIGYTAPSGNEAKHESGIISRCLFAASESSA